jgi:GMP synthase (glutamine-hydrolysing)
LPAHPGSAKRVAMTTLILDNSVNRVILREGSWTARYVPGKVVVKSAVRARKPLDLSGVARIILTGSEASVTKPKPWMIREINLIRRAVDMKIPVLGICFGHQLLAEAFDGKVERAENGGEFGWFAIDRVVDDPLFNGIDFPVHQLLTHFDQVAKMPRGFVRLAGTNSCPVQAMWHRVKSIWSIQFHPEITITQGRVLLPLIQAIHPTRNLGLGKVLRDARDSKIARRLFRNFVEMTTP